MAENKNSRKSEGLCEKIHNAVSPLIRSRNRRVSHQSSFNKIIPIDFNHFSDQNTKKLISFSPVVQSPGNENSTTADEVQGFGEREILIVNGQKFGKSASRIKGLAATEKVESVAPTEDKSPVPNHDRFAKAKSKIRDDSVHQGKFFDYISKVKSKMMKTASDVGGSGGGGGGGGLSPRRDSCNDKVTNYIKHAKIKIRTTSNVVDEKSLSLK